MAVLVVVGPTSLESSPVAPVRLQVASTVVVVSVEVVASRLLVARQPVLFRAAASCVVGPWSPSLSKYASALIGTCKKASQASRGGRLGGLLCQCLKAIQLPPRLSLGALGGRLVAVVSKVPRGSPPSLGRHTPCVWVPPRRPGRLTKLLARVRSRVWSLVAVVPLCKCPWGSCRRRTLAQTLHPCRWLSL